ncbi:MAG: hypothetical protein ACRD0K_03250 [Egibacteraceae bacterium]
MAVLDTIVERRIERVVLERMRTEPVIVLHGPRAVGKSTLLARIAAHCARPVIDLDDPQTRGCGRWTRLCSRH